MDTNLSRVRARERWIENKTAFDDVMGDPFAYPEPFAGQYQKLKSRSSIMAVQNDLDVGKATLNPARPNAVDFFCDVEHAIESVLSPEEVVKFVATYIFEVDSILTPQERSKLEQRVGRVFRQRRLSPVARYFTAIRMRIKHVPR